MADRALAFDKLAGGAANTLRALLAAEQQRQLEEMRALAALQKLMQEQAFEAQQKAMDRELNYKLAKMADETRREIAAQKAEIDLKELEVQKRRNALLERQRKDADEWRKKNMQYQRALDAINILLETKKAGMRNVGGLLSPEQLVGEGGAPLQQMPQLDDVTRYTRFILNNILKEAGVAGVPAVPEQQQLPQGAVPFSVYDPRTMQLLIKRNQAITPAGGDTAQKPKAEPKKDDIDKQIELLGGFVID